MVAALPFKFQDYKVFSHSHRPISNLHAGHTTEPSSNVTTTSVSPELARMPNVLYDTIKQTVSTWKEKCINQHNIMELLKTYYPERFARHKLSRPVPNPREVLDL